MLRAAASILIRLPPVFLISVVALFAAWTFFLFQQCNFYLHEGFNLAFPPRALGIDNPAPGPMTTFVLGPVNLGDAILVVAIYFFGLLLVYNLSVLINRAWVRYGQKRKLACTRFG